MARVLIRLELLYQLLGCAAQAANLLPDPSSEADLGLSYRKGSVRRVSPRSTVSPRRESKDLVIQRCANVLKAIAEDDAQFDRRKPELIRNSTGTRFF